MAASLYMPDAGHTDDRPKEALRPGFSTTPTAMMPDRSNSSGAPPTNARISYPPFDYSKEKMHLPSGYTTDHWAWSMSDPSFRASDSTTQPWQELDDTFLFPVAVLKEPSLLIKKLETEDNVSSSDEARSTASATPSRSSSISTAPSSRSSVTKGPPDISMPVTTKATTILSSRYARQRQQNQRAQELKLFSKESEVLSLRRQIADLTQRLTTMMGSQCAACKLGLINCGLDKAGEEPKEEAPKAAAREKRIESSMEKLRRQAEMWGF